MEFRTINNCGKLGFDFSIDDGMGKKIVKDYLENLIENIVKRSTKYFDANKNDHIFGYHEKQFHSVVCPSIADLTHYYVIEHPATRKPHGEDESSGYIDYWINYNKYSIVMELKHCYFAYKKINPNKDISKKFKKALQQLNSLKMDECRDYLIENRDEGLIKIALQTIVFRQTSQNHISNKELKDKDLEEDFDRLIQKAGLKESNFKSLWLLHDRLNKSVKFDKNHFELYPAVAFVGKVYDVVK